jgi:hypothetical protein
VDNDITRIGEVWFRQDRDRVVFLAPPGYAGLLRMFGGKQDRAGRCLVPLDRAERLIERLREHAPRQPD